MNMLYVMLLANYIFSTVLLILLLHTTIKTATLGIWIAFNVLIYCVIPYVFALYTFLKVV